MKKEDLIFNLKNQISSIDIAIDYLELVTSEDASSPIKKAINRLKATKEDLEKTINTLSNEKKPYNKNNNYKNNNYKKPL